MGDLVFRCLINPLYFVTFVIWLSDRCRQESLSPDDDTLTLDKCEEIFNTLQEDYYEEFKVILSFCFGIPNISILIALHNAQD